MFDQNAFVEPKVGASAFTCPHCHTLANVSPPCRTRVLSNKDSDDHEISVAECISCKGLTIFIQGELVYPDAPAIEPAEDMPERLVRSSWKLSPLSGSLPAQHAHYCGFAWRSW